MNKPHKMSNNNYQNKYNKILFNNVNKIKYSNNTIIKSQIHNIKQIKQKKNNKIMIIMKIIMK